MCAPFMDPNASRMAAMGLSFAAVVSGGDLSNRYFTTYAHEWGDVFTDLDDPAAAISIIIQLELVNSLIQMTLLIKKSMCRSLNL